MRFPDRRSAGVSLGEAVRAAGPPDPLVLALPRGGVPVGFEVAAALECDLDVAVVRKIGVPSQPELAMGALGEGQVVMRNDEIVALAGISDAMFDRVVVREQEELDRRVSSYREVASAIDPSGRTAVVVDDGLATGSTAMAAIAVTRQRGAAGVWVAVPVAPRDTTRLLEGEADRVIVLEQPRMFGAVGLWYRNFEQTSDEEVRSLLAESRLR